MIDETAVYRAKCREIKKRRVRDGKDRDFRIYTKPGIIMASF